MGKITTVALREFWTNVRRPGFIFVTLFIPALGFIATLIAVFAGGSFAQSIGRQFTPVTRPIGFVDQSGLGFRASENFIAYPNEEAGLAALRETTIGSLAIIPTAYLATGQVTVYTAASEGIGSEIGTTRLREFLRAGVLERVPDPGIRERALAPMRAKLVRLPASGGEGAAFNPVALVVPFILAALLIASIFTASGFMLQGVSEEKETRVMEVLLSSVTPTELMAGKILGLGALGLLQVSVWFGGLATSGLFALRMFAFAFGFEVAPLTLILAGIYFILGYLLYSTLMAVCGSIATSLREGQQVAAIFTFSAIMPLSFASLVFTRPNGPFAQILSLFPLSSPTMMMIRMSLTTVPTWEIVASLVLLVLFLLFSLWGGAKVFRAGLLMYGKRLSLGEIWGALRAA